MDSRKINLSTVFAGQNERFVQSTPPLLVLVKVVGVAPLHEAHVRKKKSQRRMCAKVPMQ
jgi:hypothetical protein